MKERPILMSPLMVKAVSGRITSKWPYRIMRNGTVMPRKGPYYAQFVRDDQNEGHILIGGAEDKTAEVGDTGTLTFTEGGPTGGYWKFKKDTE